MITIEKKIDLFEKMIMERHIVDRKRHLETLKIKYAQLLDEMEGHFETERREKLVAFENKITKEMHQLEAREKVAAQRKIREHEAQMVKLLMDAVKKQWLEVTKSERYGEAFERHLYDFQQDGKTIIESVVVSSADFQRVPQNLNPVISSKIIGGFIIKFSENQQLDFTIDRMLEEMTLKLGCMVDHLISDGGTCDERL